MKLFTVRISIADFYNEHGISTVSLVFQSIDFEFIK